MEDSGEERGRQWRIVGKKGERVGDSGEESERVEDSGEERGRQWRIVGKKGGDSGG